MSQEDLALQAKAAIDDVEKSGVSKMSEQPCSQLVTGTVKNHETGDSFESAMMMTNASMETMIKVQAVHSQNDPTPPMALLFDCLALDGVGEVFGLHIHFPFLGIEEYDQMLMSFTVGALWKVKGMFAAAHNDGQAVFTLLSPEFQGVASENIPAIESAFRINGKGTNIDIDD